MKSNRIDWNGKKYNSKENCTLVDYLITIHISSWHKVSQDYYQINLDTIFTGITKSINK